MPEDTRIAKRASGDNRLQKKRAEDGGEKCRVHVCKKCDMTFRVDPFYQQGLPSNAEAERSILGACLLDNAVIDQMSALVPPTNFFLDSHRRIAQAMLDLNAKSKPVDLISLSDVLRQRLEFEQVGGATYIAHLIDGVPRTDTIEHYAEIVNDKAAKRKLITLFNRMMTLCFDDEDLQLIFDEADGGIFELMQPYVKRQVEHASTAAKRYLERIKKLQQGQIIGKPTGFIDFDQMTAGLEGLTILAARPTVGKTAFATNICQYVGKQEGEAVIIFELEMSADILIGQRLLASEARVDAHRLRSGFLNREEWDRLEEALRRLSETGIYIDDTPGITLAEMRMKSRRLKAELNSQGRKLGLIVADYLNLMTAPKAERRDLEIAAITHGLKNLHRELDVPILALTQIGRRVEERSDHRPKLSDLRESGDIEADADLVVFLYNHYMYSRDDADKGIVELIIGKQRNGPTGTIKLAWLPEFTRFENMWKE